MSDEKLIHVKMDYVDALESKRSLLNLQKNLLGLGEVSMNFSSLRTRELGAKVKFYQKIKGLSNSLNLLKKNLPEGKIPKIAREAKSEESPEAKGKTEKIARKTKDARSIESQLSDIQEKLRAMQG